MKLRSDFRAGITLIELLVAMSIIAILGALLTVGIRGWINAQGRRNTETTIKLVHKALQQHWDAVVADAKKEPVPSTVLSLAGGAGKDELARVIWIKLRLMEAFPVNFDELDQPYKTGKPLEYIPQGRRRYMQSYGSAVSNRNTTTHDPRTESAACLLMALGMSHFDVQHNVDMFKAYVKDTDNITNPDSPEGDRIPELVDGWGQPLRFYRFATGNTELQATAPTISPNYDPLDPKGRLRTWVAKSPNDPTVIFDPKVHERKDSSGNAWYAVPVIFSIGPPRGGQSLAVKANTKAEGGANACQDMSIVNTSQNEHHIYSFKLK